MALWIILLIILIGLILIFLEVFLIPGTTLFGIVGGAATLIGVVLIYTYYGTTWGHITVAVTFVAFLIAIAGGFKTIQSNKLAMKAEITGKVNELEQSLYKVGDKGMAASELRPNGKAVFGDNKVEVYSVGEYIQRGTELEITKITNDKIFVKPSKT